MEIKRWQSVDNDNNLKFLCDDCVGIVHYDLRKKEEEEGKRETGNEVFHLLKKMMKALDDHGARLAGLEKEMHIRQDSVDARLIKVGGEISELNSEISTMRDGLTAIGRTLFEATKTMSTVDVDLNQPSYADIAKQCVIERNSLIIL